MIFLTTEKFITVKSSFYDLLKPVFLVRGETGLFPEAYVEETFESDAPPAIAPPPLPQVRYIYLNIKRSPIYHRLDTSI